jgi:hypothetical protein
MHQRTHLPLEILAVALTLCACGGKPTEAKVTTAATTTTITVTVENPCAKDGKISFSGVTGFAALSGKSISGKSKGSFDVPLKEVPVGKATLEVKIEAKLNALQTCRATGSVLIDRVATPPKVRLASGTAGPSGSDDFGCADTTNCEGSATFRTLPGSAKFRATLKGEPGDTLEVAGQKFSQGPVEIDLIALLGAATVDQVVGKNAVFPFAAKATSSEGASLDLTFSIKAQSVLWELLRNITRGPVKFIPTEETRTSARSALIADTGHWVRFVGDKGAVRTLSDVDLIVHNAWERTGAGNCPYQTFTVAKTRYTDDFTVFQRTTGKKIANKRFAAAFPACPMTRRKADGDVVTFPESTVEDAWVRSLLK